MRITFEEKWITVRTENTIPIRNTMQELRKEVKNDSQNRI
jgi:hypothetical protein